MPLCTGCCHYKHVTWFRAAAPQSPVILGGLSPLILPTYDNWLLIGAVSLAVACVAVVSLVSLPPDGSWCEQFLRQNVPATLVARTHDAFGSPPSERVATGALVLAYLWLLLIRNSPIFSVAFSAL